MRHAPVPDLLLLGVATLPMVISSQGPRGILYWRREDGPRGTEGFPTARDVGIAWVIEIDGTERLINGGDPITRAEAKRLASVGEYTFDAED